MTVTSSVFSYCCANGAGGGGMSVHGTTTISNTSFLYCINSGVASDGGSIDGALRVSGFDVTCVNSSFMNGWSNTEGGAVGFSALLGIFALTLHNCTLGSNRAEGSGGALRVYVWSLYCVNCSFEHNTAGTSGGAICLSSSSSTPELTLNRSVFISNRGGGGSTTGFFFLIFVIFFVVRK
jgi:predicted outer membrane repeat protein